MITLRKIISGGQTGVDQMALRVARELGFETGGTAAKGWMTEDGPQEALLRGYGLRECVTAGYPARTKTNVRDADLTVWFGTLGSAGGRLTIGAARLLRRSVLVNPSVPDLMTMLTTVRVMNVAGNRASVRPESATEAERVLREVLR